MQQLSRCFMAMLFLAVVISCSPVSQPLYAQLNQNLLVNPDAETGNINGWTDPDQAWGAAAEITPHGGKYFFWPARKAIENTTMYQDVQVSSLISAAGGEALYFHLSGWLCNWDQYPHDRATLAIEARDVGGAPLAYYSTEQRNPAWIYHAIDAPLPAGTAVLRVLLIATRFVGSDNDAYFDDLSLVVNKTQAPSVSISAAGNSRVVKISPTLQLTAQTMGGNDTSYTWTSSFPSIATVNAEGRVTGVAAGHVFIQARGNQTGAIGSIELSVVGDNAIAFLTPAAGAAVSSGSTYNVTWQLIGTLGTGELLLSTNGGVSYTSVAKGINCATGAYSWTVPTIAQPLRQCVLKMTWSGGEATSGTFSIVLSRQRVDLIGSWSSGIWSRNSSTGAWTYISSAASQLCAGDLDGDGVDDVIGSWPGSGIWVKYSATNKWAFIASGPVALASGDMNGDHKAEIVGIWGSSIWSRDGATDAWTNLASGASQIALGDLDGDGKADLIGIWPGQIWVKYSSTGKWAALASEADGIACGDLNGDGKSDLLGVWGGAIWMLDSATGKWTFLASGARQITAGDLDGDGKDDLVGTWAGSGVWVKYSATGKWEKLVASVPDCIATVKTK